MAARRNARDLRPALLLWVVVVAAIAATILWMNGWGSGDATVSPAPSASAGVGAPSPATAPVPSAARVVAADVDVPADPPDETPVPAAGVRIAVVIDDLGRSLADVHRLRGLGVPVAYAVLPFETRTREVVELLGEMGAEILLHLPMQASGEQNPGPGALLLSLDRDEIRQRTEEALRQVPGAVGVNNHMGSAFTSDEDRMRPVLEVVGEEGLFFLDSRTAPGTRGFGLAREMGIDAAERSVFLDNDDEVDAVRAQFRSLLEAARRDGSAIAIGHPYDSTLLVLEQEIPAAVAAGYEFVPVSALLERSSSVF